MGGITTAQYAATQVGVILHYLKLSVWPSPLVLDYDWPAATTVGAIVPAGLMMGGLLGLTAWCWRRQPAWGFVGVWFFLVLAPSSSFIPVVTEIVAEHRMYLPLASVVALVVLGGYELMKRVGRQWRWQEPVVNRWVAGAVMALAAILCLVTIGRNQDYRSELVIWQKVVATQPGNGRAHNNLGGALLRLGKLKEAKEQLALAVQHSVA